ncbi:hypothetical protein Amsp01_080340 [Amycolatopsis sp. NBRC 101858]|uniref:hypothetical protein n=1 Tax=Amycolatopsis sp. NBRC 101858 TaxID=3032200 RepID=UPI0024A4CF65|nr:hypothetical protein [Amycolatopsis sp. NBRC 101858]GLY42011.1 hypothetical protein Amsp01_080340 [Amycolatopsis sp. NBRC 101858]
MNKERRIKLLLRNTRTDELCLIAWFSVRNSDLYWGPGTPGRATNWVTSTDFSKFTITVPDDLDSLPLQNWKVSHHKSGVMHVNSTSDGQHLTKDVHFGSVVEISAPKLISLHISRPPKEMPTYHKSPSRAGARTIVLNVPEELWARRHYFEFYVSPAGTFEFPGPILALAAGVQHPSFSMTFANDDGHGNPDLDLIISCRANVLDASLSAWHPEAGVWALFF